MIETLLVTALLVIPAAALILIGDRLDPLSEAKKFSRKSARTSADTTNLRIRLEELGKATDLDYEKFCDAVDEFSSDRYEQRKIALGLSQYVESLEYYNFSEEI